MAITIKIKVDTAGEEPSVVTQAGGGDPGTASVSAGSPASRAAGAPEASGAGGGGGGGGDAAPPPDLLARAQAIGAHNAGAAPAGIPTDGAPPAFVGDVPRVALDEASYAEGLSDGPTDVSAGAAPGATEDEDLVVEPTAEDADASAADETPATDAGTPRRRARKAAAKSTTKK